MKIKFFKLAKAASLNSWYHHKIGAVIVNNNKPISSGYNKPHKTHPRSTHPFQTIHAELDAIIGIPPDQLKQATIYLYREHFDKTPATSKPCKYCQQLLIAVGIKNVYYTDSNNYYQRLKL